MDAKTLMVPNGEAVAVAFPGYVKNTDRALEMLGGLRRIQECLEQPTPILRCRPRSQDDLSHPLLSTSTSTHRLLLRISKKTGADGSAVYDARVEKRLPRTHEFKGLVDFQVVSSSATPVDRTRLTVPSANRAKEAEPDQQEHPLLMIPPIFAPSDQTFDYSYKAYTSHGQRNLITWVPKGKPELIAWSDARCPAAMSDSDVSYAQVKSKYPEVMGLVDGLFSERVSWMYPHLQDVIQSKRPNTAVTHIEACLACVAYRIVAGPFRGALLKRGYDPRKTKDGWCFQVLSCVLPDHWFGSAIEQQLQMAATKEATPWKTLADLQITDMPQISSNYANLASIKYIPSTRTSYYQVCDICDDHVTEPLRAAAIADSVRAQQRASDRRTPSGSAHTSAATTSNALAPGLLSTCHERTGWFPLSVWQSAGDRLTDAVLALLPSDFGAGSSLIAAAGALQHVVQKYTGAADASVPSTSAAGAALGTAEASDGMSSPARDPRAPKRVPTHVTALEAAPPAAQQAAPLPPASSAREAAGSAAPRQEGAGVSVSEPATPSGTWEAVFGRLSSQIQVATAAASDRAQGASGSQAHPAVPAQATQMTEAQLLQPPDFADMGIDEFDGEDALAGDQAGAANGDDQMTGDQGVVEAGRDAGEGRDADDYNSDDYDAWS